MHIFGSWRRLKRLAIGLGIVIALALIANGVMAWRTEAGLQRKIAAIRAGGDAASIAELAPKPIPDAENAAVIVDKLAPRLDEFAKDNWRFLEKTPLGKEYDKRITRGEPATEEQLAAIRELLNKYPDIDAQLALAASCDKYASVADFSVGYPKFLEDTLESPMQQIRTAARFLNWRMQTLVAAGDREQALEQGIELLKLARLHDSEPLMVNMLVGIALRGIAVEPIYDVLAAGPVSPAQHAALDRELALHDDGQRLLRAMRTERAFSIDAIMTLPLGLQPAPSWLFQLFGWPMKRLYIGALDYYDVELAALGRHDMVGPHQAQKGPTGYGILADLLIPASQAAYDADARITAQLRALRIFNALRQFAEKNGHEATNLDDLGLPQDALIDPFDGKPLKLKHTDAGWMVYSVMGNGVDDGGDFMEMKDYGVAPARYRITEKPEEAAEEEGEALLENPDAMP